jgi:anaerobic magnesium-protoporphyrin IX monomethyl ester cyclase
MKEIFFENDTFTIIKQRVREICAELQKRQLDVHWSRNARATLDYKTMRMMNAAGCRLIDVGHQSGSDQILKTQKKESLLSTFRKPYDKRFASGSRFYT